MFKYLAAALLLALTASAEEKNFEFANVADTTSNGFAGFGNAPAINNAGAVAFVATGSEFGQGVFKWQRRELKTIGGRKPDNVLINFGETVAINSIGTVGYSATLHTPGEAAIFTSNGVTTKTIVDSLQAGLVGAFLGVGGMNDLGTVAFLAFRGNLQSQAILTGNGGPLSTVVDSTTSAFQRLGNADINDAGDVVFRGFRADNSEGIFVGRNGVLQIADTNSPPSFDFLDPVINNAGVVGDAAFLLDGGIEVFTGKGGPITQRTDPAANQFSFVDNVTINNSGAVAFFADKNDGGQGIFLQQRERTKLVPVIQSGDSLFGSTVTGLQMGRFALNEHRQLVFKYTLQNGRSGIAIASATED